MDWDLCNSQLGSDHVNRAHNSNAHINTMNHSVDIGSEHASCDSLALD